MGEVESEGQRLANEWADECLTADAALAIDAALRAAKAKVWREAATVHRQADGNDCKYCLARAAQIEEGE